MTNLHAAVPGSAANPEFAPLVWDRFGDVRATVKPFFGSGAVLFGRPADHVCGIETVNNKDGMVANFWHAAVLTMDAGAVWSWADSPVNEADLHARHLWLLDRLSDSFVSG